MSIKKKLSYNVYEIYPESFPDKIKMKVYRGDTFYLTLIGYNEVDNTPFDFSLYSDYNASLKIGDSYNNFTYEYSFKDTEFLTDYRVLPNYNPDPDLKNELHVISKDALDISLTNISENYTKGWFDVEGVTPDGETQTFIKALLVIELDITN